MTTEKTAAAAYREQSKAIQQKAEIVDVTVPSGFVFKFYKPSAFGMIFELGGLPMSAVSAALTKWQDDGVGNFDADGDGKQKDDLAMVQMMLRARKRVLDLSVEPKLVVGIADESKGEISTSDVADVDLAFLFNWVLAGGETSAMLATFPGGPQSGAVAQPNRKERRAAGKQARGNNG